MFRIAAYPEPESSKEYSASLKLKSTLVPVEGYEVVVTYGRNEVVIECEITP